jgi:hypothetical protein
MLPHPMREARVLGANAGDGVESVRPPVGGEGLRESMVGPQCLEDGLVRGSEALEELGCEVWMDVCLIFRRVYLSTRRLVGGLIDDEVLR